MQANANEIAGDEVDAYVRACCLGNCIVNFGRLIVSFANTKLSKNVRLV